jgi:transposase
MLDLMSRRFRTCDLDQPYLMPPSLQDWLPQHHLARFIVDVVNELDLSAIYGVYERKDSRGQLGYHPLLLVRLLLYGYAKGVTSSRRIEQATREDVAFRYLAANQHPDHDTISSFRQRHLDELAALFVDVLRLCQKAGLVKLGNVAIDGTKMMANASPNRSANFDRLNEREQYWLNAVHQLLADAQRVDQEEDTRYGKVQSDNELPSELADAQTRLERIRQAKQELLEEARRQLEVAQAEAKALKEIKLDKEASQRERDLLKQKKERAKKRLQRARANAKHPGRQYNFVDPDSRVMRDNAHKNYVQGYNAQAAVDSASQVVVAAEITQQVSDKDQLLPMVSSVCGIMGAKPEVVTADAGYWDSVDLVDARLAGIDVLVAPDAMYGNSGKELAPNAPRNQVAKSMRERLASAAGRALYSVRKTTIEPVFGQIKQARGIRRFSFRGATKVAAEWKLICATHNLLKLFRSTFYPETA